MSNNKGYVTDTGAVYARDLRDPPINQNLVDVEVVSRVNGLMLGQHWTVTKGKHTIRVPKSDVPIIMAQVETEPEHFAVAQRAFDAEVDRACESYKGPHTGDSLRAYMLASINSSPGAHYRLLFNRDPNPLDSAKVLLPNEYPAPKNEEAVGMASLIGKAIADALAGSLAGSKISAKA